VAPEDLGNVGGWQAEMTLMNRNGKNEDISPQDFYRAKKAGMTEETRKGEKHKSEMETERAKREQGNFTPYVLGGNALGAFNTRTGAVTATGETAQPKPGALGSQKDVVIHGDTLIPNMEPI
jgi:hypothetical protein